MHALSAFASTLDLYCEAALVALSGTCYSIPDKKPSLSFTTHQQIASKPMTLTPLSHIAPVSSTNLEGNTGRDSSDPKHHDSPFNNENVLPSI